MNNTITTRRPSGERQLAYWQQQLADDLPDLRLPFGAPAVPVGSGSDVVEATLLDRARLEAARLLSRSQGCSLFVTLLASFFTLLHRYSQQDDILIAVTVARNSGTGTGVGGAPAQNVLLLRGNLCGDLSFNKLLARVGRLVGDAHRHGDVPVERIVRNLKSGKGETLPPLFRFQFTFPSTPVREPAQTPHQLLDGPGLTGQAADLRLRLRRNQQGLEAALEYNTALFDAGGATRMLGHLRTLVEGALRDPGRPLSSLPILPDYERLQLVRGWAQRRVEYPKDFCIHQLIEAQVQRNPDGTAVVFETATLSYLELNRRANGLARRLAACGVGPEVPVGVCMERSLELAVAVLGLLKAGGMLVPLDPDYPPERLQYILEQTAPPVILAQQRFLQRLGSHRASIICLEDTDEAGQEISANPVTKLSADNLCAVFFTSGTTGAPKAVLMPHRVCCRALWSQANVIPLGPSDRGLLMSSISFGAFLGEFYSTLIAGGTLVFARPGGYSDIDYLLRVIARDGITLFGPVPSVLRAILDRLKAEGPNACQSLRHIFTHGEALPPELQDLWTSRLRASAHNFYGLTEAPGATYWNCRHGEAPGRTTIGRPTDMEVYLLDHHMQLVPIGVPGEIYVGGPGLARGYLGRPDLTAERFVPNPLGTDPGSRLYRTGDLGRWLPEGVIEFLGRVDDQVKIRGVRIEVREIEVVLARHPDVDEAVVALQEPRPGEKRLTAWVVGKPDRAPQPDELRRFLGDWLPGPMIPAVIFAVKALPRTANGKLDRQALANMSQSERQFAGPRAAYQPPRDFLEEKLAGIWERVLDVRPVGADGNFFELGGHSLLALQLIVKIEEECGKSLPLSALFQAPTVAGLARVLRQEAGATLGRNGTYGRQPTPLFCLNFGTIIAQHLGRDQPVYALDAHADEVIERTTVESQAAWYVEKIRSIQPKGPYFLAGYCALGIVAIEMARQFQAQGERMGFLALFACQPFPDPDKPQGLIENLIHYTWRSVFHLRKLLQTRLTAWPAYLLGRARAAKNVAMRPFVTTLHWEHDPRKIEFLNATCRYRMQPYSGRITVLLPTEATQKRMQRLQAAWRALPVADLEIHVVPGKHVSMWEEPHIQTLAEQLKACLQQAQAEVSASP